jgi:hypothetical protein
MKKQTAVEWFYQRILAKDIESVFEQSKEMEKEQLCKMYVQGRKDNHLDYYPEKHAKETYDEMFKGD